MRRTSTGSLGRPISGDDDNGSPFACPPGLNAAEQMRLKHHTIRVVRLQVSTLQTDLIGGMTADRLSECERA